MIGPTAFGAFRGAESHEVEQLAPDHVVARLRMGRRLRVHRWVLAVVYTLPVAAAALSGELPRHPGMSGLLCFGAMVWGWTLLGVAFLGWATDTPVLPWSRSHLRVLEVRGSKVLFDGAAVDGLVRVGRNSVEIDGVVHLLYEALSRDESELLRSAVAESMRIEAARDGGEIPPDLQRLREQLDASR